LPKFGVWRLCVYPKQVDYPGFKEGMYGSNLIYAPLVFIPGHGPLRGSPDRSGGENFRYPPAQGFEDDDEFAHTAEEIVVMPDEFLEVLRPSVPP
jgi:hypothetical protein